MAVAARGRAELAKQWRERETSPERTKVWTEPKHKNSISSNSNGGGERKVSVVYYLSRNGHLEHPHVMEVPLFSAADGLYLRDVINRLNLLRGKGMASMYAWSCKRSYKNGFVWHDLSEDDFIYPAHGNEYVLKGSELLQIPFVSSPLIHGNGGSSVTPSSSSSGEKQLQNDSVFPLQRRNKTPWNSFDLSEYKVYKPEITTSDSSSGGKPPSAADASTQTDDRRRNHYQRRQSISGEEEITTTELSHDEISPPPSSSSPENNESLIITTKPDNRKTIPTVHQDQTVGIHSNGRNRAAAVLMHLISCGSISVKDHGGFSLAPQFRARIPKPRGESKSSDRAEIDVNQSHRAFSAVILEDKEYFSGSLIETKKTKSEFSALKRSSSYNAERFSALGLEEKETEGGAVQAKCIPRRPRLPLRRENRTIISGGAHGSKRINDEPLQSTECNPEITNTASQIP